MNIFTGVEEPAGGDGDVANFVTVKGEVEFQLDCLLKETRRKKH